MNKITKSTLSFLIISFIVAFILLFLGFYVYSNRSETDPNLTIHSLRNGTVLRIALIQTLKLLPPLIICIFITAFSIFFTFSPFQSESFAYPAVAVPSFIVLLGFILVVVLSEFLFIPKLYRDREKILYTSRVAHSSLVYAKKLYANNEPKKAIEVLDIYLEYEKNDEEANKLYDDILETVYRIGKKEEIASKAEKKTGAPASFYERGKVKYEKGNYFEALFYLERALSLHKDNREIKELYEMTKERARGLLGSLTKDEKDAAWLITQKGKALQYLDKGEYYEAHDIFLTLTKKYPRLYDLRLYLEETEKKLTKIDFRIDELKEYEWLPSFNNIPFIDTRGTLNVAGRIIPYNGTFYFYNIHRYSENDGLITEATWKYGKWIGDSIRLKNRKGFRRVDERDNNRHYIYTAVNPGYLLYFSESSRLENQLTVYEHLKLTPQLKKSGLDIESRYTYLSKKIAIFFSIYVLSLVLGGIAWSKRSIYEFPPFFKIIIFIASVPLFTYLLHYIYMDAINVFIYTHRYIIRYVFKNMNLLVYTAIINILIAAAATVFYLSQGSEVE